ncbi:family 20 glycosylhydrolase [Flavilitoribacter nigricans]|uniref:beta-N-acetylhexosaminidase n=1 Tax=Flavilitoribacter nigricans (strain ATCC 23147 / DSM 23189 / NBRC 102662 / NCIMB 1420 / SS-2) TaxID=1122177 RepID=A0A2D0N3K3_FLAN2|nr:family 20 glycosylhydrolase [Flavilitoribacter nigricans]PHN02956.1 beta-N-acetylhexosaminidase [Flavilitoribacter nigricans DSM 23189 = NBRC 102662]
MNRFSILLLLSIIFFQWNCQSEQTEQTGLENVAISWQLESNQVAESPRFRASFTITNRGNTPIEGNDWSMYFSQTPRDIVEGSVTGPAEIERVNGDLYQLRPASGFSLTPGDSLTITYEGEAWLIKETDAPLGLYFVQEKAGGQEETIPVARYTIWPFENEEQYSRHKNDKTPFPEAALVFDQNTEANLLPPGEVPQIIPFPRSVVSGSGKLTIDGGTTIHFSPGLQNESEQLRNSLGNFLTTTPTATQMEGTMVTEGIVLSINAGLAEESPEAYQLDIDGSRAAIQGKSAAGVFRGIQSLLALVPVENWIKKSGSLQLPQVAIKDAPLFAYRGMMLDIARNFNDLTAIKKLIDGMAFYKLNKLHLHLTDDEGWRLEIPGLPELTDVGARRGHTADEADRLAPAYGSGPGGEGSHGTGYLSRSDFIELLQYATRRHIEVIPELNMPGHARAAIKSMEARYRKMSVDNDLASAEAYRLADPEDQSEYRSVQYYPDNVVCVCCEGTYRFYEKVVDEVRAMYTEAGAVLTTIHTGGDEVPGGVWTASPACADLIDQEPDINSTAELPTYFFSRISQILADRGLKAAGWEEIAMQKVEGGWVPHPDFANGNVIPFVWQNLWGNQDLGYRLANAGYPVVLCNVTNLYFDLAYNKDPREPGFYWGGFVDTRKAFDFRPFDVFTSTNFDPMGNAFDVARDYKDMERLQPAARKNILGIQGQLWSETIKGQNMMEYYIFPKLLGLAQRAWSAPLGEGAAVNDEWEKFANALGQRELIHLDYLSGGYNYRIPTPGAKIENGKAMANVPFPGLTIRYTTDGSEPSTASTLYAEPVAVDSLVCFKAFDQRGRSSRMICVNQ